VEGERSNPGRILIAGLGSIGRRHLATVRSVLPDCEVVLLRRPGRPPPDGLGPGIRVLEDPEAALATHPEAAIIANPAPFHVATALPLARAGVPLLVEKPLSDRPEGVDALLAACAETGGVLQVGYCLRFDPSLRAVKEALAADAIGRPLALHIEVGQYLPDWRPGTDYRDGVSARADLGGGVLLELSHEIDYARWLAGEVETVFARTARSGALDIDVEDTADLILDFENGIDANLHMDMLCRPAVRVCRINGTAGTLYWDGIRHESRLFHFDAASWQPLSRPTKRKIDTSAIFKRQFRHFLSAISGKEAAWPDGEDAWRTLEVIRAARESGRTGRKVVV